MYHVVFVCMGNICRSPTAEVVFRAMLEESGLADQVAVSSSGTGNWHVGDGIDDRAGAALTAAGLDASAHRARQFVIGDFDDADLILAMDRKNRWLLTELAPTPGDAQKVRMLRSYDPAARASGDLDVPDPYYDGPDGFANVLAMVQAACRGLLDEVRAAVRQRGSR